MTSLIVGCGYLGSRVARRLVDRGERVLGTTRSPSWVTSLVSMGIEPIVLDVLEPSRTAIPDFDRLVYCVGFDRESGASMRSVYVDGLAQFLERLRPGQTFVYTSSTGVYSQDDGSWVTENDPTEPRHESGRICLEAETIARNRGASIIRLAGLYGPGRIVRRAAILANEPVEGDPEKVINLIQIDDAAVAVIAALDAARPARIYNAVDDRPVSRRELYTLTAALLEAPAPSFVLTESGSLREDVQRRIVNRRIKDELGIVLAYSDITTGLPASIAAERSAG